MDTSTLPQAINISLEVDNKKAELRSLISKVQNAYLQLREDKDYPLPPTLDEITVESSRRYFQPIVERLKNDPIITDEGHRHRLVYTWARKQAKCTQNAHVLRDCIDGHPEMQWRFDSLAQNVVAAANVDQLAEQLTVRTVPPEANEHWGMVRRIAAAIDELRQWEAEHGIRKIPLAVLTRWEPQRFAEEWAAGMGIPTTETLREKVIRLENYKYMFRLNFYNMDEIKELLQSLSADLNEWRAWRKQEAERQANERQEAEDSRKEFATYIAERKKREEAERQAAEDLKRYMM